jgi:hypothetical protein
MHQAMVAYQGLVHVVTIFLQQEQSTRQTKVPLQRGGLRDFLIEEHILDTNAGKHLS